MTKTQQQFNMWFDQYIMLFFVLLYLVLIVGMQTLHCIFEEEFAIYLLRNFPVQGATIGVVIAFLLVQYVATRPKDSWVWNVFPVDCRE